MKARIISIAFILASLTIFSSTALAHSVEAGTTPDSPLYGLDVALDRIKLLLTFDNTMKAERGLLIAQERLLEVREMLEQNKLEAAQRAQNEHAKILDDVKTRIGRVQQTDEIEEELREHEDEIRKLKDEMEARNVPASQKELIDSILSGIEGKAGEVRGKFGFHTLEEKPGEEVKKTVETAKNETKTPEVQAPKTYTVEITSVGFSPGSLKIKSGDTVNFVNRDSSSHWVASNPHPIHTGYAGFDAGKSLVQGGNYSFTFVQKGTFGYHDHLSTSIGGTITVE